MNEVQENRLRNEFAKLRNDDPVRFVELLFESVLARLNDSAIAVFPHKTGDSLIVVFKGAKPMQWAKPVIAGLEERILLDQRENPKEYEDDSEGD